MDIYILIKQQKIEIDKFTLKEERNFYNFPYCGKNKSSLILLNSELNKISKHQFTIFLTNGRKINTLYIITNYHQIYFELKKEKNNKH